MVYPSETSFLTPVETLMMTQFLKEFDDYLRAPLVAVINRPLRSTPGLSWQPSATHFAINPMPRACGCCWVWEEKAPVTVMLATATRAEDNIPIRGDLHINISFNQRPTPRSCTQRVISGGGPSQHNHGGLKTNIFNQLSRDHTIDCYETKAKSGAYL